jgi:hypothetical protein
VIQNVAYDVRGLGLTAPRSRQSLARVEVHKRVSEHYLRTEMDNVVGSLAIAHHPYQQQLLINISYDGFHSRSSKAIRRARLKSLQDIDTRAQSEMGTHALEPHNHMAVHLPSPCDMGHWICTATATQYARRLGAQASMDALRSVW